MRAHRLLGLLLALAIPASAPAAAASPPVCTTPEPIDVAAGEPIQFVSDCSDAESDALTFAVTAGPQHGYITDVTNDGGQLHLTYTSDASPDGVSAYSGPDSFTFSANDGTADSAPVVVELAINRRPWCQPGQRPVLNHTPTGLDLDDTCADWDAQPGVQLTYEIVTGPAHGTLGAVAADGGVTYTPTGDYAGDDSFVVRTSDGHHESAEHPIAVKVAENYVPGCGQRSASAVTNKPMTQTLSCNPDPEGDTITLTVATPPTGGSVTFDGINMTYTGFKNGPDSFSATLSDGHGTRPQQFSIWVEYEQARPLAPFVPSPLPNWTEGLGSLVSAAAKSAKKVDPAKPVLRLGTFESSLCPTSCTVKIAIAIGGTANPTASSSRLTTLGRASYVISFPKDVAMRVRLNKAARKLLRKKRKLKVSAGFAIVHASSKEVRKQATSLKLVVKKRRR